MQAVRKWFAAVLVVAVLALAADAVTMSRAYAEGVNDDNYNYYDMLLTIYEEMGMINDGYTPNNFSGIDDWLRFALNVCRTVVSPDKQRRLAVYLEAYYGYDVVSADGQELNTLDTGAGGAFQSYEFTMLNVRKNVETLCDWLDYIAANGPAWPITGGDVSPNAPQLSGNYLTFDATNQVQSTRGRGYQGNDGNYWVYYFSNIYTMPIENEVNLYVPDGFAHDYGGFDCLFISRGSVSDWGDYVNQVNGTFYVMKHGEYTLETSTLEVYDVIGGTGRHTITYVSGIQVSGEAYTLSYTGLPYVFSVDGNKSYLTIIGEPTVQSFNGSVRTYVPMTQSSVFEVDFSGGQSGGQVQPYPDPERPDYDEPAPEPDPTGPTVSEPVQQDNRDIVERLDAIIRQITEFEKYFVDFRNDCVTFFGELYDQLSFYLGDMYDRIRETNSWLRAIYYEMNVIENKMGYFDRWYRPHIDSGNTPQEQLRQDWDELTGKFPFSLPWDVLALIGMLKVDLLGDPVIELPYFFFGNTGVVYFDLGNYHQAGEVSRWLSLWMFRFWIVTRTKQLLIDGM